jgi:hypothetical protein
MDSQQRPAAARSTEECNPVTPAGHDPESANMRQANPLPRTAAAISPRPAYVSLPRLGGDSICHISTTTWRRLEAAGLISLTRVELPGSRKRRLLLPVNEAIAVIEKLGARASTSEGNDPQSHSAPTGGSVAGGAAPEPRQPRGLLLKALVSLDTDTVDLAAVTESGWRDANKALDEIRAASPNVSTLEIENRAETFRKNRPGLKLTPAALAEAWADCDRDRDVIENRPPVPCAPKETAT